MIIDERRKMINETNRIDIHMRLKSHENSNNMAIPCSLLHNDIFGGRNENVLFTAKSIPNYILVRGSQE